MANRSISMGWDSMGKDYDYIMDNDKENIRLEVKTDVTVVAQQAKWAGIQPGMRVADVGCGPGKTSRALFEQVQPDGEVMGIDIVPERVVYAKRNYQVSGIRFVQQDARAPLHHLGEFDFIWVRFLLEYHGSKAYHIVQNLYEILKPGGILCLIDLDYNCLSHYGIPERLNQALLGAMEWLQRHADFDPYVGRKLYSFLYDLKCLDIDAHMAAHHLIFGELDEVDEFNWTIKAKMAMKHSGYDPRSIYPGGYEEFMKEFKHSFSHPRRFTYTPVIMCRGVKPSGP